MFLPICNKEYMVSFGNPCPFRCFLSGPFLKSKKVHNRTLGQEREIVMF